MMGGLKFGLGVILVLQSQDLGPLCHVQLQLLMHEEKIHEKKKRGARPNKEYGMKLAVIWKVPLFLMYLFFIPK